MSQFKVKKPGKVVDLKVGESLSLDLEVDTSIFLRPGLDTRKIRLTLEAKHGQVARVRVHAAEEVKIGSPEPAPT